MYWSLIINTSKHGGHAYDLFFVIVKSASPKMKFETFGDSQHLVVLATNLDTNYWITLAHIALMGDEFTNTILVERRTLYVSFYEF